MKSIVWLASYPKSGNTWLRLLLANYLAKSPEPVPLKDLPKFALGDALAALHLPELVNPLALKDEAAVLRARPKMLARLAATGKVHVLKTHNTNQAVGGVAMIPPNVTRAAIYILRDPRDLVLSYGAHYGLDLSTSVQAIGSKSNQILEGDGNVRQYLGRWSDHVRSWITERRFPVLILRYEDLQNDTATAFSRCLERIGLVPDEKRVAHAVEMSQFDRVRAQEQDEGFSETPENAERFFRSGRSKQWENVLPADLAERLEKDHSRTMKKFGYLSGT